MNGLQEHLVADPTTIGQWIWNLSLLGGALFLAIWRYRQPAAAAAATTTKVQEFAISGAAQFTDMNPIRELVKTTQANAEMMERCAIALEENARANLITAQAQAGLVDAVRDYIEDLTRERYIEREIKARMKEEKA